MQPIFKQITHHFGELSSYEQRVLTLDPTYLYENISIDIFKRRQTLHIDDIFIKNEEKICCCGCGKDYSYSFFWNSNECRLFCESVWGIICGYPNHIKPVLLLLHPNWECVKCGSITGIHIDHIVPIFKGGGGCWLNNYQPLCKVCHLEKTLSELI